LVKLNIYILVPRGESTKQGLKSGQSMYEYVFVYINMHLAFLGYPSKNLFVYNLKVSNTKRTLKYIDFKGEKITLF